MLNQDILTVFSASAAWIQQAGRPLAGFRDALYWWPGTFPCGSSPDSGEPAVSVCIGTTIKGLSLCMIALGFGDFLFAMLAAA